MPNTYNLIASNTVGSGGASTITFSSIPSTYTDLVVRVSGRSTRTGFTYDYPRIKFNSSSSGYTDKRLYGTGSGTAASDTNTETTSITASQVPGPNSTSNTFGNMDIYIPNYASANYKSVSIDCVTEEAGTTAYAILDAALWSNTAAINQIDITLYSTSNYAQYSTFTLYGINKS